MVGFDLHNAQVCFPRSVILHFCRSFDLERERGTGERAVAAPGCHVTAGHNIATDVSPGPSCHLFSSQTPLPPPACWIICQASSGCPALFCKAVELSVSLSSVSLCLSLSVFAHAQSAGIVALTAPSQPYGPVLTLAADTQYNTAIADSN